MITNNPQGNSSRNGNLWTAHYVYGLSATNQLNSVKEEHRILQVYQNNFSQPGILCRTPNFPDDRQAQDDLYGVMGAEALLSPHNRLMTRAIYNYGEHTEPKGIDPTEPFPGAQNRVFLLIKFLCFGKCKWVWNNVNPGTFDEASWLGRFPAFLAVMQMSLRYGVNPFFWTYWAVTTLRSAWLGDKTDNNGDCLILQGTVAAQGYGPLTDWICKQFHGGIKRKYGNVGGLMAAYFDNPDHPLVALLSSVE
jgi:hypothetical protein